MPTLKKLPNTNFHNDNACAQRGAREQLKVILANKSKLLLVRNGKKYLVTAVSFNNHRGDFTPNQLSFIDAIYEKVWKGAGYESSTTTFKPNKKNVRGLIN